MGRREAQSVEMETRVRGRVTWGERVREGRVAQASLASTSEVRTLHCLFNREQISKKIEAHQSFEWEGYGGAAANVQEISNLVCEDLAKAFVTERCG